MSKTSALGVFLIVMCTCLAGSRYVMEDKLLHKYSLEPLYIIGMEGLFGSIVLIVLLPILTIVKCSGEECPHGTVENFSAMF